MADPLSTPQLAFPFRLVNGDVECVEQDSERDIVQCAIMVLRYEIGQREALIDFGRPDLAFRQNGIDLDDLIRIVKRWVPNVQAEAIRDAIVDGVDTINIELSRGTNG